MNSDSKPSSEPKNQIKNYEFCRRIITHDKDSKIIPENETPKNDDSQKILSFNVILYEEEIAFKIKEVKDNLEENSSFYEKSYNYEDFKEINKIFEYFKNLSTVFESLKIHFEKNKDVILLENDAIIIKLKINLDIFEESFSLTIPLIQKSSEDTIKNLIDSVYYLNKEKISLKEEILNLKEKEDNLNNTVVILKKELNEISKYIKEKLNPNSDDEEIIRNYEIIREIKKQNKNDDDDDDKIYKNEIKDYIIESSTPNGENLDIFTISLKVLLYEEKIKIYINEIQDDLKTNYLEYESIFTNNYFEKYKIKFDKGIENIYDFLCNLFEEKRDELIKEGENKIIINLKFPVALEEEIISLEINKKELSLEKSLKNLTKTVQILNKENKHLKDEIINIKEKDNSDTKENKDEFKSLKKRINDIKEKENNDIKELRNESEKKEKEFQKMILLKVYPVGSYYLSNESKNPSELFGGRWEEIHGRFLFATASGYSNGQIGGEEKHRLTIDEMPAHSHGTETFARTHHGSWNINNSGDKRTLDYRDDTPYSGTRSTGGGNYHNNMPPYLCAYCWKRIG